MIPVDDPTALSLLFHLNSEPWLNAAAYRAGAAGVAVDDDLLDDRPEVALPEPPATVLDPLLAARRSCRAFAPTAMPLVTLAALLGAAYGVVAGDGGERRSVPSAGGLYPLDPWVFTRRVDGLEDGLWRHDPVARSLRLVRAGDASAALEQVCYAWPFVEHANAVVALVATFDRAQAKYGPRGYRYILLEAGHAGQNLCLAAAGMGLATLCMGGFADSGLNQVLGLDPLRAGVVYAVAVGTACVARTQSPLAATPPAAADDHKGG